ncbi:hypothetical protein HMPREF0307_00240 [Corynebacterium sp. DNF00584]|nr:hypothetical protein HMPREF0307_00240 [Corynebacterium sp. DNF00584]
MLNNMLCSVARVTPYCEGRYALHSRMTTPTRDIMIYVQHI